MRKVVIPALLATTVVCALVGMEASRTCTLGGAGNDTETSLLIGIGAVALGVATAVAVRIHWLPRAVIATLTTALALGALVILDALAWVAECD